MAASAWASVSADQRGSQGTGAPPKPAFTVPTKSDRWPAAKSPAAPRKPRRKAVAAPPSMGERRKARPGFKRTPRPAAKKPSAGRTKGKLKNAAAASAASAPAAAGARGPPGRHHTAPAAAASQKKSAGTPASAAA